MYPHSIEKLISFYKKLPSIGEKTAERLALATIDFDEKIIDEFVNNLSNLKTNIHKCKVCNNLSDTDICPICSNQERKQNLICVVEDYKSAFSIENAGNFEGTYHILGGLISPMNGIGPENINIFSLVRRVEENHDVELIIALKSSIEGETTTLYLKKIFENKDVLISRLSYGLPMGAEIEYLDILTLDKALEDRKQIS